MVDSGSSECCSFLLCTPGRTGDIRGLRVIKEAGSSLRGAKEVGKSHMSAKEVAIGARREGGSRKPADSRRTVQGAILSLQPLS